MHQATEYKHKIRSVRRQMDQTVTMIHLAAVCRLVDKGARNHIRQTRNGSDGTGKYGENCFFPSPVRGDMSLECIGTFKSGPTARLFRGKTFHRPECTEQPFIDRNTRIIKGVIVGLRLAEAGGQKFGFRLYRRSKLGSLLNRTQN